MNLASSGLPGGALGGLSGRLRGLLEASGASRAVLEVSCANLEASWTLLGRLGGRLGPSWADLEAILDHLGGHLRPSWPSWRPSWSRLGQKIWEVRSVEKIPGPRRDGPKPVGRVLLEKVPKPTPIGSSTPGTPLLKQKGAADRRRLRRTTAAPCLFGSAYVAER